MTRGRGRQRAAAVAALVLAPASLVLAVVVIADDFRQGVAVLACGLLALLAAWYGVLHRGAARTAGLAAAVLLVAGGLALIAAEGRVLEKVLILAGLALALGAARAAFAVHVELPPAPRPRRPVAFVNPKSGGGKAEKLGLAAEARGRGIEPVELAPGDDLRALVHAAVERGADALAMAGGDGSQAIVAGIAAERGLPYACIPAGTRNHFALDLGVDREDVVGALDAFVDGGERRVDLAEVNGRTFVNNVSLGLYGEAVKHSSYRDAKLRTLLDAVPDVIGPDGTSLDLRFVGPDGREHLSGPAILVSNNRYRLGKPIGSGTRPRIDDGLLGIAVVRERAEARRHGLLEQWSAPAFTVESEGPVLAGIDGEAAELEAPVTFRIRPGALRVRIARGHPGASPSAAEPDTAWATVRALARIATGREVELEPV
jgi:diacylglycerol kinase family enzyme